MQDNDRKENEDIETIIDKVSDGTASDEARSTVVFENADADVALVFETELPEMLTYEEASEEAPPEPKLTFTAEEEVPPEPKLTFTAEEETPPAPTFTVPERFEPSPDIPEETTETEIPRTYTTYVPRFTSVTEKYRVVGVRKDAPTVKETERPSDDAPKAEPEVDPLAEMDEGSEVDGTVSVNVKTATEEEERTASTVFKFSHPAPEAPTPCEEMPEPEPIPEPPVIEEAEEPEPEPVAVKIPHDPNVCVIPDPVTERPSTPAYTVTAWMAPSKSLEDPKEGVGDPEIGRRGEYRSYSARDGFKDRFLDGIMSIRIRFFVALAFFLILLVAEDLYMFGMDVPSLIGLSMLPGAMAIADAQLVLCLYLLAIPEIVMSFKRLVRGDLTPELFITLELAVIIAYTVLTVYTDPITYPLFGLIFAVSVLAAIGASYFKKNADFTSFKVVSQNGEKTAVDIKHTRTLLRENAALDGTVEEHRSKTARFFRTVFASDFFARSEHSSENKYNILITLAISLGASGITAVIAYFLRDGLASAAAAFTLVFMLACPALSIMLHKTSFFSAVNEASAERSVAMGERALFDYSGIDVITFEDDEVFGKEDVNLRDVKNFDNTANPTKALRQMSALFMNVGGPLDVLFSDMLDKKTSPAQNTLIEIDGISGEIDGHTVLAGPRSYMLRKGVAIPENDARFPIPSSESVRMMYIAEDGVAYSKLYIRYSFSEDFSMLLPALYDSGITPLVYSRDPNIDGALVKYLTAGVDKIRVMKKTDSPLGDVVTYSRISTGMVTLGNKDNAVNMILLAKRYTRLHSRLAMTELIAAAVGAALAAVLSLGGMSAVPTVVFAAWQAVWCGVLHFMSARSFNSKNAVGTRQDGE